MNENAASPVEVRRQIWESLVSMLRVYAHAASLNGIVYTVTSSSDAAWLRCGGWELEISYSAEDGAASWQLSQPPREVRGEEFRIEADGTLAFPGGLKELDLAAIEWVEKLVHASTVSKELVRQPLVTP